MISNDFRNLLQAYTICDIGMINLSNIALKFQNQFRKLLFIVYK